MANRYNSSSINSIRDRKIFFDANILIYLFGYGTPTKANWEDQYARLYTNLNIQKNQFVIDFIVISEFINRAMKLEYDGYLRANHLSKEDLNYKDYRDSRDGQETLEDIYLTVSSDILSTFEVVERSYSKDDLTLMCKVDCLDFSDKAIVILCQENNFVLLTNDKDFIHSSIDTISCNRNLR